MTFQTKNLVAPALAAFSMLVAVPASAQSFNITPIKFNPCSFTTETQCTSPNPTRPRGCSADGFTKACQSIAKRKIERELNKLKQSGEAELGYTASEAASGGLMPNIDRAVSVGSLRFKSQPAPPIDNILHFGERLVEYQPKVHSCEEYVYQLGHDYARYKVVARHFGSDYKSLYTHAYDWSRRDEGAIGARGLYASHAVNRTMGRRAIPEMQIRVRDQEFPHRAKNDFFYIKNSTAYQEFERRHPSIANKVNSGQQHYQVDNIWTFHKTMGHGLRNVPAARLEYLREKRKEFLSLLKEHKKVTNDTKMSYWYKSWKLRSLNNNVERMMLDADAIGCLNTSSQRPSACDWSHRDFHEEISRKYENRSQFAQRACIDHTGDRFSSIGPNYRVRNNELVPHHESPTKNAFELREYLNARNDVEVWSAKQIREVEHPKNLPKWGDEYGDAWSKGNSVAGADVSYNVSWGIDLDRNHVQHCDTHIHGLAELDSHVKLFGSNKEIIEARASFNSDTNKAHAYLSILDNVKYNKTKRTSAQDYNIVLEGNPIDKSGKIFRVGHTIYIAGIPINLAAGASGKIGFESKLELNAGLNSTCAGVTAKGEARPYVGLQAFAEAAVGFESLGAGARADLTLVDASLPASIGLSAEAGAELTVAANISAKLNFEALAGSLYAFLNHPTINISWDGISIGTNRIKETLFSWSGFTWNKVLLEQEFSYGVSIIEQICSQPEIDCSSN